MSEDERLKQLGEAARRQRAEEQALRAENPALFLPEAPAEAARPPRRPWRWLGPATGLAAAAAVALWFLRAPPPPLPEYALELKNGGLMATRTATRSEGPVRLSKGLRLELVARPATRVDGAVEAKFYVVEGQRWTLTNANIEAETSGTIRVVGNVGAEIPLPKGDATLVLLVGRELPGDSAVAPDRPGTRVAALPVTVQP